ncbi:MAG TPA: hypothetical protein VF596_17040 [Pyrinomonadaceae bacterium]|jgi:hypothetical protein
MKEKNAIHLTQPQPHNEIKKWLFLFVVGIIGLVLIHIGNVWSIEIQGVSVWYKVAPKTVLDLGIGFVVAAIVSGLFDITFHQSSFGKPVQEIERRVKILFGQVEVNAEKLSSSVEGKLKDTIETVGELNSILKSASQLNINAIQKRQNRSEMNDWRDRVEKIVDEAQEFVYIAGKTLEELFSTKTDEPNLNTLIENKLQNGNTIFKFVFANPYDTDSCFRQECEERRLKRGNPSEIWHQTKRTVEQILKIKYEGQSPINQQKVQIKINKELFPFVIVITEKCLLVQHYLPYVSGRDGLVIEITKTDDEDQTHLYNIYKKSYEIFFNKSESVKPVFERYVARKPKMKTELKLLLTSLGIDTSLEIDASDL